MCQMLTKTCSVDFRRDGMKMSWPMADEQSKQYWDQLRIFLGHFPALNSTDSRTSAVLMSAIFLWKTMRKNFAT